MASHNREYVYEDFLAGFGRSNRSVLAEKFGSDLSETEVRAISDEKETAYRALVANEGVPVLPGVVDWLERFAAAGRVQSVSSSAPMANIVAVAGALGIADYFSILMSGAELLKGKPDPTIFLNSAAALGLGPSDCLVIEDSIHGIEAAVRAGMASVAVGPLVQTTAYADLIATAPSPACIGVDTLGELTWVQIESQATPKIGGRGAERRGNQTV